MKTDQKVKYLKSLYYQSMSNLLFRIISKQENVPKFPNDRHASFWGKRQNILVYVLELNDFTFTKSPGAQKHYDRLSLVGGLVTEHGIKTIDVNEAKPGEWRYWNFVYKQSYRMWCYLKHALYFLG